MALTATDKAGVIPAVINDWPSIRDWRNKKRDDLISDRIRIGSENRKKYARIIQECVMEILSDLPRGIIGFYWPIKGEFDFRGLIENALAQGWQAALPVVVNNSAPLEFRRWKPSMKLVPGIWNIPVPEECNVVSPSVLLVPLVGFDSDYYRLGYGGGYYDRTLTSFSKKPVAIGVGLETAKLGTIYPQTHDIPMDMIVTEKKLLSH